MDTHHIGESWKNDKSYGGPLNHRVGGLIHITVQNYYDPQFLTMRLSDYINTPSEYAFLDLKNGMEYLMHHPHEPLMYSRKKNYKTHEIPQQCYFKAGDT